MGKDTALWEAPKSRKISKELSEAIGDNLPMSNTNTLFNHINGSSSPGMDGFTVAYLRVFWNNMKYAVQETLNNIQTDGLSQTSRNAVIKLFGKGIKNPLDIGNYRQVNL